MYHRSTWQELLGGRDQRLSRRSRKSPGGFSALQFHPGIATQCNRSEQNFSFT
jgi:hypothetical protein